ncbi:MAG TPA: hypothetical protein VGM37_14700 [Armatimonadota bacterium]|jgi:hypothetical protein
MTITRLVRRLSVPLLAALVLAGTGARSAAKPERPQKRSSGNEITLSNGTGDGSVTAVVDPYGAIGSLRYDPSGLAGPTETMYESFSWFSGPGQTGGGHGAILDSDHLSGAAVVSASLTQAVTQFDVGQVHFRLVQEILPNAGSGSTLRQTYQITNNTGAATAFDMIRYADSDLDYDGKAEDNGGVSGDGQSLFQYDAKDNPVTLSTFLGIDLNNSANIGYRIASAPFTSVLETQGRAALTKTMTGPTGPADVDGDGLADKPYDMNLLLGETFTAAPGATVTFVTNTTLGDGSPGTNPRVFSVYPARGGNVGTVSTRVIGTSYATGAATVKLVANGQPDIVGVYSTATSGRVINATFNLQNAEPGVRDVVVSFSNGKTVRRDAGFSVEAGGGEQIWTDVIGPSRVRANQPSQFSVVVGNRGNVDAKLVPIFIVGIPKRATFQLGFQLNPPPDFAYDPQPPSIDFSQVPAVYSNDTEYVIPVVVGLLPPGATRTFDINDLRIPGGVAFDFQVYAGGPLYDGPIGAPGATPVLHRSNFGSAACINDLIGVGLSGLGFIPGLGCGANFALYQLGLFQTTAGFVISGHNTTGADAAMGVGQILVGQASLVAGCLGASNPISLGINIVSLGMSLYSAAKDCLGDPNSTKVQSVASYDPNEIDGSQGAGPEHYVNGREPLRYTVMFENKKEATAPAHEVNVTLQLDPAKLDFNTFSLGQVAIGDKRVLPPPGLSYFITDVDLRPARNVIAHVEAGLDKNTGLITWRFTSINPATGQPVTDPSEGILPPNVNAPEGEGRVLFTIKPNASAGSGTEIRERARIIFDANAPIDTNEYLNTLDNAAPDSQVAPLPATQPTRFTVNWAGADTGSGIRDYDVFVSDNGGAFLAWQARTTATSATFEGQNGHLYGFYSVAHDYTSNDESAPSAPDAVTTATCSGSAPAVTGQVAVTRNGFHYNHDTGVYAQTLSLKNTGATPLAAPLTLVLDNLSANASLANGLGNTTCSTPLGSPFLNANLGAGGALKPGDSAIVTLEFSNRTNDGITYTARLLSGEGSR